MTAISSTGTNSISPSLQTASALLTANSEEAQSGESAGAETDVSEVVVGAASSLRTIRSDAGQTDAILITSTKGAIAASEDNVSVYSSYSSAATDLSYTLEDAAEAATLVTASESGGQLTDDQIEAIAAAAAAAYTLDENGETAASSYKPESETRVPAERTGGALSDEEIEAITAAALSAYTVDENGETAGTSYREGVDVVSASEAGGQLTDDQIAAISEAAVKAYTLNINGEAASDSYLDDEVEIPVSGSGALTDAQIEAVAKRARQQYTTDLANDSNPDSGLLSAKAGGVTLEGIYGTASASLEVGGTYVVDLGGDSVSALSDVTVDTSDPDDILLTLGEDGGTLRLKDAYGAAAITLTVGEETLTLVDETNTTYEPLDTVA